MPKDTDQAPGRFNGALRPKPTAKATAAALIPMLNVSSPDFHHVTSDHRLLIAPTPQKVAPVATMHEVSPPAERDAARPLRIRAGEEIFKRQAEKEAQSKKEGDADGRRRCVYENANVLSRRTSG